LTGPGGLAEDLTVAQLADAVGVPEGTLKVWLRLPGTIASQKTTGNESELQSDTLLRKTSQHSQPIQPKADQQEQTSVFSADQQQQDSKPSIDSADPQMATILHEWPLWEGDFSSFCDHLKCFGISIQCRSFFTTAIM
jgi:hypothetical protein